MNDFQNNIIRNTPVIFRRDDLGIPPLELTVDIINDYGVSRNKVYVGATNPEDGRMLDGSMPDIDNYMTTRLPRLQIFFKYMTIENYRKLYEWINDQRYNQFVVEYYDYIQDKIVSYAMYAHPMEIRKMHQRGLKVLAVLDESIELVGTLNQIGTYTITYHNNIVANPLVVNQSNLSYGDIINLLGIGTFSRTGYKIESWNEKADGTGKIYLPNSSHAVYTNLTLYADWIASA